VFSEKLVYVIRKTVHLISNFLINAPHAALSRLHTVDKKESINRTGIRDIIILTINGRRHFWLEA